ncbi:hypothetical protein Zm00014a_024032 [Zea mays]|jgi:hypothetical protein|nr:hypothetical protein Zm00014a_024032 [Zea mays]
MSVVAAVGPAAAASYGQPLCGGGARKRKDAGVVQDQDQDQDAGSSLRGGKNAALFVLETVEEEADADTERSSIGAASEDGDDEEEEEVASGGTKGAGAALACMDMGALDDALPIK